MASEQSFTKGKGKGKGKGKAGQGQRGGGQNRGRDGVHPCINRQIIVASESQDLSRLMSTITTQLSQMNLVNLSTALHRVAKLVGSDSYTLQGVHRSGIDSLIDSLQAALHRTAATEVQPQTLSNVAWSLATMRIAHRELMHCICQFAMCNIAQFKAFEVSTTLWAVAKLCSLCEISPAGRALFHSMANYITSEETDLDFRCLATTSWAYATAKQGNARLFRSIATQMLPLVHTAKGQEMANTVWAFATAEFHADALFEKLAKHGILRLGELKPQELSNMLWGFATNGFFHECFYAKAAEAVMQMEVNSQHLANILWAFARVRPRDDLTQRVVLAMLPLCTARIQTFKPQEVSSTLLAVAKTVCNDGDADCTTCPWTMPDEAIAFFKASMPCVLHRYADFSAQSLANTISSYAKIQVSGSKDVLECLSKEVQRRFHSFNVSTMVHLLRSLWNVPPEWTASFETLQMLAGSLADVDLDHLQRQELQSLSYLPGVTANDSCTGGHNLIGDLRSRLLQLRQHQLGPRHHGFTAPEVAAPAPANIGLQMAAVPTLSAAEPWPNAGQELLQLLLPKHPESRHHVAQEEMWQCPQENDSMSMTAIATDLLRQSEEYVAKCAAEQLTSTTQPAEMNFVPMHMLHAMPMQQQMQQLPQMPQVQEMQVPLPKSEPVLTDLFAESSVPPRMESPKSQVQSKKAIEPDTSILERHAQKLLGDSSTLRRWVVKNSFLHVEDSESDVEDDASAVSTTYTTYSSSHRSSSVPISRLTRGSVPADL